MRCVSDCNRMLINSGRVGRDDCFVSVPTVLLKLDHLWLEFDIRRHTQLHDGINCWQGEKVNCNLVKWSLKTVIILDEANFF